MTAYRCPGCDYTYEESKGAPREGFPAGTPFDAIPDDWCCPDCAVREKVDFQQTSGDDAAAQAAQEKPDTWLGVNS